MNSSGRTSSTRQGSKAMEVEVGSTSSRSAEPRDQASCPRVPVVMRIERARFAANSRPFVFANAAISHIADLYGQIFAIPPGAQSEISRPNSCRTRHAIAFVTDGGGQEAMEAGSGPCSALVLSQRSSMNLVARTTGSKRAFRKARSL